MFREIKFKQLVPGKKYLIKYELDDTSYNVGIYKGDKGFYNEFENVNKYTLIDGTFVKEPVIKTYFIRRVYYDYISQKANIQNAMEKRALVQLLANIGVHHFDW
jgi:hypothetical protein